MDNFDYIFIIIILYLFDEYNLYIFLNIFGGYKLPLELFGIIFYDGRSGLIIVDYINYFYFFLINYM